MSDQVDEFKNKGNQALKDKNFEEAIKQYSEGINIDKNNKALLSNRSVAFLSVGKFEEALKDAEQTIESDSKWFKGYIRKANALLKLQKHEEASVALDEGLKFDPENAQLKQMKEKVEMDQLSSANPFAKMFSDPSIWTKIKTNPKTSEFLNDPSFVQKIQDIQKNPNSLNSMFEDQRIMTVVASLIGVDLSNPMGDFGNTATNPMNPQFPGSEQNFQSPFESSSGSSSETKKEQKEEDKSEPMEEEEEEDSSKKEAEELKQKGNEFYKKRDFEKAIEFYDQAIEKDSENIVFRMNKAAALLESGKYEETIKVCKEGIEVGRKVYADFKQIAKALARIGNAYVKLGDLENAIEFYKESLTEHRTRDIAKKLNQLERELTEKKAKEYINPEKAMEEKKKGDEFFKKQNYPDAVKQYREAIKRDPSNHIFYSNLAISYMKLGDFPYAVKNFEKTLELDEKYVKAYTKKAQCHFLMKEYHKALDTLNKGLKFDPQNRELLDGMQKVYSAINTPDNDEERVRRAQQDPEIQQIISDPFMVQVLNTMKEDPASITKYMNDPVISEKIQKLIAAGIIKTG